MENKLTKVGIEYTKLSREKLLKGVKKLSKVVSVTMGPKGRNVLIRKNGDTHITKDGVTVAKEVFLKDEIEDIGAQVVKEVSGNVVDEAGDGTTTATVLSYALLKEGNKFISSGIDPVSIKRGMDKTLKKILTTLDSMSRNISSEEDLKMVATISANSDEKIGELVAEAINTIGVDGSISLDISMDGEDHIDISQGMKVDSGYISPRFINDKKKLVSELKSPLIFVTERTIGSLREIIKVLEISQQLGKPLLIICDNILDDALNTLIKNKEDGVIDAYVIKAPSIGERKLDYLNDISLFSGAKFMKETDNYDSINSDTLGSAEKIIIKKDNTIIIGGSGNQQEITSKIEEIKELIKISKKEDNDYEEEKLRDRLGKISGGIAILKVGSNSESELLEKIDRIDDAISATQAAAEEGIVIGGGLALIKVLEKIDVSGFSEEELYGYKIIKKAVYSPFKIIVKNAGLEYGSILGKIELKDNEEFGVDVSSGKIVNMFKSGIIDPVKVTKSAIKNAVSIAGMLLTSEAVIFENMK